MMRRLLPLGLVLLAACQPAPTRTTLSPVRLAFQSYADSLVRAPMFRQMHWGILVVDPVAGDTLYSHNAGKLFMPASNQKLLTGSTALAKLGPDFRFRTRLMATPRITDGVLEGDLVVVGRGDPSVSDAMTGGDALRPLRSLADALTALGVREIAGRLVRGGDAFPDSSLGFGWSWDDLDYAYSAPVDELFFNEGYARIIVKGGVAPGAPVTVRSRPSRVQPRFGRILVTTVARDSGNVSRLQWVGDARGARPSLDLTGTVRVGDSVMVNVALRNPSAAWLDAFAEVLAERGITIRRGVEPVAAADTAGLTEIASLDSPPLREILPVFEKPSQNQIGEILFKTLGLELTGVGTADSGRHVVEQQLLEWGAAPDGFAVRDGSGLSRHNYLSPETIIRVLDAMRKHEHFRIFYDALPIAGVDGTIRTRMRGTPAAGNVHAKTGTIDKARALSGYVTTADGRLLLVSMLANNHTVQNREVERVQDLILARLAGSTIGSVATRPSAGR